ncbi:MAG: hypothetical protein AB7I41_20920 [Candidatus Sericytochromatia bacterium]
MSPSVKTVERWHQSLKSFRFYYAIGGHANDGDTILGRILFNGEAELLSIFEKMEIPLQRIPEGAERPVSGRSYTSDEYARLAHPIWAYPAYQEPGLIVIWGIKLYLEVHQADISMILSGAEGDPWSVTEKDVKNAFKIEAQCETVGIRLALVDKT